MIELGWWVGLKYFIYWKERGGGGGPSTFKSIFSTNYYNAYNMPKLYFKFIQIDSQNTNINQNKLLK